MYLSQNWVPDNVNGLVFSSWRPSTGPLVLLALLLNQLPALHPPPGLGPSCRRHWLQAPPARHSLACPAQLTVGLWTLRTVNSNQLGGVKLIWLGLTDQKKGESSQIQPSIDCELWEEVTVFPALTNPLLPLFSNVPTRPHVPHL